MAQSKPRSSASLMGIHLTFVPKYGLGNIWIGQYIETRVRLNGLDRPELRGKCQSEKKKPKMQKLP